MKQQITKILKFLNKNRDKQLHFFYIFLFTELYFLLWKNPCQYLSIASSFAIMFIISLLKQQIDMISDYKDIIAGIMGWLVSIVLMIIRIFIYK